MADFEQVLERGLVVGVAEVVVVGGGGVPSLGEGESSFCTFCQSCLLGDSSTSRDLPSLSFSPRPTSRKPTASMHAWLSSAMAS